MTTPQEIPEMPEDEKIVADLVGAIRPDDLGSLIFPLSRYQQFNNLPTVVLGYTTGQVGMCVWNLEPGQANDFHVHPNTEHMHIVIEGECEYTLGDHPPVVIGVGDAVMVPAGIAHGIRNISDKRMSYLAVTSPGPYQKIRVERAKEQG